MGRLAWVVGLIVMAAACGRTGMPAMTDIVFLTRDGCVQTEVMRARLDEALRGAGLPEAYNVVDLSALAATDPRVGYPTPTVLLGGRDLFGLAEPRPPYPEPT